MFQHGETIKNMSKKQLTYIDFIVLNSVNPLQNQEIERKIVFFYSLFWLQLKNAI